MRRQSESGEARPAATHPHRAWPRLQPAGGAMSLSIRWRLTLWNTLALAVVLLGFAGMVYALLARALYEQTDHKLLAGYQQLEHDERLNTDRDGRIRYWIDEMWEHENIVCVVYDQKGQVIARTTEIAAASVPSLPDAATGGPQYRTLTVPILGRRRALAVRQPLGNEECGVLVLASLEEVDLELNELL